MGEIRTEFSRPPTRPKKPQIHKIISKIVKSTYCQESEAVRQHIETLETRQQQKGFDQQRENLIVNERSKLMLLEKMLAPGDPTLNFNPQNKNLTEAAFTR